MSKFAKHIFIGILFFLLSIYITYPLVFHLGNYATGRGDELLIAWINSWDVHVLTTNPLALFNANIFYPYHNSLAFSDIFLTTSILSYIPLKLIGEPIAANNITLIASLALLAFSVYSLAYYLTKNLFASFLSGILVMFSPATLGYYVHLQVLAIEWVPFAILSFIHFLKTHASRYLLLSLFFFVVQTYNSFLPGYFILFSFAIIFVGFVLYKKVKLRDIFSGKHAIFVLLALLIVYLIAIPYFQVSKQFHYVRDIRDSIHLALQPEDFLWSSNFTHLSPFLLSLPFNQISQNNEFKPGYLGVVFTLLAIFACWYAVKHIREKKYYSMTLFFVIAMVGLTLSLGPFLHLGRYTIHKPFPIPLPYALFYYVVPGFQGFRNAARWEMLFIIGIAVVIGIALSTVLKKFSFRQQAMIYFILLSGCVIEFVPMQFYPITQAKDFPQVSSWLRSTPSQSVVIEMPIYNWNMFPYGLIELQRMYYSTANFRTMVNGGSGFSPPPWQEMVYQIDETFPSPPSIARLKNIGVNYLIIHKSEYTLLYKAKYSVRGHKIESGDSIIAELNKNQRIKKVSQFGNDYVYHL